MAHHLSNRDEHMSAFIDGELEAADAARILVACRQQQTLKEDWAVYHCIGDILRSDEMGCHSTRLSAAIALRLEAEPFLMASPVSTPGVNGPRWRRPTTVAAAAAAVIAVALIALPQSRQQSDQVAAVEIAPVAAPTPVLLPPPSVSGEYIAAHRQYARTAGIQAGIGQVSFSVTEPGR